MDLLVLFLLSYLTIGVGFALTQRVVYLPTEFVPDDPADPKGMGTQMFAPFQPTIRSRIRAGLVWLPAIVIITFLLVKKRLRRFP
jgi:hypothetical protein